MSAISGGTRPTRAKRPGQKPPSPSRIAETHNTAILMELDSSGLHRVRVGRLRESMGAVEGHAMTGVTTQYLDGHERKVVDSKEFHKETESVFDLMSTLNEDVTDFARLRTAHRALVQCMSAFRTVEPSPEQVAVFAGGYHNLMDWRRKAREQMTRIEGEMDVVEILLAQIL